MKAPILREINAARIVQVIFHMLDSSGVVTHFTTCFFLIFRRSLRSQDGRDR